MNILKELLTALVMWQEPTQWYIKYEAYNSNAQLVHLKQRLIYEYKYLCWLACCWDIVSDRHRWNRLGWAPLNLRLRPLAWNSGMYLHAFTIFQFWGCLPLEVIFISSTFDFWFGPLSFTLQFQEDQISGCWYIQL